MADKTITVDLLELRDAVAAWIKNKYKEDALPENIIFKEIYDSNVAEKAGLEYNSVTIATVNIEMKGSADE